VGDGEMFRSTVVREIERRARDTGGTRMLGRGVCVTGEKWWLRNGKRAEVTFRPLNLAAGEQNDAGEGRRVQYADPCWRGSRAVTGAVTMWDAADVQ